MKFEPLKERDPPPNDKVVVKKVEFTREELLRILFVKKTVKKKLLKNGFNLNKRFDKREDYDRSVVVYEQKKYIIPKVKRYEET